MEAKPLPDIEVLHAWFHYNHENGILYNKKNRNHNAVEGSQVGFYSDGYLVTHFQGKVYKVHRVVWAIHHGRDPGQLQIDHINGNRVDNRINNLRLVTCSQNNCNARIRSDNTSGVKGVSWHKEKGKWRAEITKDGVRYRRNYRDMNHAIAARVLAEYRLHGEYAGLHRSKDDKDKDKL